MQLVHAAEEMAPITLTYRPAIQPMHANVLACTLYVPAGQAVQTTAPATTLYAPALHAVHAAEVPAPAAPP